MTVVADAGPIITFARSGHEDLLRQVFTQQFPVEQQESLAEILKHRLVEKRREKIAQNARDARKQFDADQLPVGSVEDLVKDLLREDS